jgi:hypothetical protein
MTVAGLMLAHQVAGKAVRDATFLSAWPTTALPTMVIATAAAVIVAVPIYARLLSRFSPRTIVPAGFLLSAIAHLVEWVLSGRSPWIAVAIYLHIAGLGALLLSGFWSVASELFDPRTAKASYGRIAASGTAGGLVGGLSAARIASQFPVDTALLFLAAVHLACAVGVFALGRGSSPSPLAEPDAPLRTFELSVLRKAPHLKTLAVMVLLSTASAAIVDWLFKSQARAYTGAGPELLQFFSLFYTGVQVVTFLAQMSVNYSVRRYGLGRTVSSLPAGLGLMSTLALLFPAVPRLPMFSAVRGTEAVLRGSLFRSGYELLFVPMDPAEKRRMKTFLDVTCDRAGDAIGASVVSATLWIAGATLSQTNQLLAVVIGLSATVVVLGRRLDALYLKVVERQLVRHADQSPLLVASETGWTLVELPAPRAPRPAATSRDLAAVAPPPIPEDPRLRALADLRSGDRARVERALARLSRPDRSLISPVVQLMAWDDVVAPARAVLEREAPAHVGLLVDILIDPDTDFAIRRRLPRILGLVPTDRALDGLIRGLEDTRFEVRYQCARAIDRLLVKHPDLSVDRGRILAVVLREVSVPQPIWEGYQLIDRVEREEESAAGPAPAAARPQTDVFTRTPRNVEHVFALLAAVLPRDPLQVAFRGIQSPDRRLRGLAIEYLESVMPGEILAKLLEKVTASADDAPGQSDLPPGATPR